MKTAKLLASLIAIVLVASLSGCYQRVNSGHEGVKFDLYGDNKGLQEKGLPPGGYWIGWNEELYEYPVYMQQYTFTANPDDTSLNTEVSFQTKDGLIVSCDIAIEGQVISGESPKVFGKFRKPFDEILKTFVYQNIKDKFQAYSASMGVEAIYGEKKNELLARVEESVSSEWLKNGIKVENISYLSPVRVPSNVERAINAKIEATQQSQQRENEVATARAEAQKAVEQARGRADSVTLEATAQAEANKIINASLSSNLIQYETLKRWDGKLPYFNGGGAVPFVNVDAPTRMPNQL